jgi:hypothetical protein
MKKADDAARIELEIQGYLEHQPSHQDVYNELVKAKEITSAEPMLRALATSGSVQYYNPGFAAAGAAAGGKRRGQKTRKHSKKGKKTKKCTRSQRGGRVFGWYGDFRPTGILNARWSKYGSSRYSSISGLKR